MKKLVFSNTALGLSAKQVSLGLLVLRIVFGIAMMTHGWGKIQSPMNWMGPDAPVPGILQALAALSEFGGGLALVIGLLVPLASLGMAITMFVAMTVHIQKGDAFNGGWEMAAVYAAISIMFMLLGAGRFSLDHMITSKRA